MAVEIPDIARIVAFRNVLVHAYTGIDDRLVWGVIERELPGLIAVLASLLRSTNHQA